MTMVPSQNGKHYNNNNNNIRSGNSDYVIYSNTTTTTTRTSSGAMNQVEVEGSYNCLLGSDFVVRRHNMAESEESSRHNNNNNNNNTNTNELEPEAEVGACGSNSKEEEEGTNNNNNNNNWLQLSIGTTLTSTKQQERDRTVSTRTGSGLVELDLLPSRRILEQPAAIFPAVVSSTFGGSSSSLNFEHHNETTSSSCCSSSMSMSMHMTSGPITTTTTTSTTTFGHQEMMNWAFGPLLPHHQYHSMPIMPSSSSFIIPSSSSSPSSSHSCYSSLRPPLGSYFPTPFHHHFPPSSSGFDPYDVAVVTGQSSDTTIRVVDPPRRPHSGIWFMLQASQNQTKEPFLPQIPKNYLRIKDGRMTVRLLLKYLVSKLRLESESEIEITCRGQQLLPFLTLQHVRDNIWTQRDNTTQQRALLSDSSTTDHVMVLHYGRSTS